MLNYKPIKLTSSSNLNYVKKTLKEILSKLPIEDLAFLSALWDKAWDLDLLKPILRNIVDNSKISFSS